MYRVCVNPGHSGSDSGNVAFRVEEDDLNWAIALETAKTLERHEVSAFWSRSREEKFESKAAEFAQIAARAAACDRLVSIHDDSGPSAAQGISVLYLSNAGAKMAAAVYKHLEPLTPWRDRGLIHRTDLAVLNQTNPPAILVETDFNSNPAAHALLISPAWQKVVGEAIARGVLEDLGVKYVPPKVETLPAPTSTKTMIVLVHAREAPARELVGLARARGQWFDTINTPADFTAKDDMPGVRQAIVDVVFPK